jgi:hypothetical protein
MATHVDWARLDRSEFERIVNVLITRDGDARGFISIAPDGRGGDAGIDIELRDPVSGRIVHIYQLKHFPEGFSSGWAQSRRKQIRKSLRSALQHEPDDWTLVVPEQYTAAEQKFVTNLAHDTSTTAHVMGTVELNKLLTQHTDVHDWAVRDAVNNALDRVGRRDVQPTKTSDAAEGLSRYLAQQDTFSLYWGRKPIFRDGGIVWEFYTKRDDAPVMEPLRITMNTAFGADDAELRKLTDDVFGYGRGKQLDLPEHVVQSLVLDGPAEWFAGVEHNVALSFTPMFDTAESRPARIEAYDRDGALLGALSGRTINSNAGDVGGFVEVLFESSLTTLWRFPRNSRNGSTDITLDAVGQPSAAVARATRFLRHFKHLDKLRLEVEGHPIIAQVDASRSPLIDDELHEYADDLGTIERLADVSLPFPAAMPDLNERIWTRITRMLLEGRCALIHNYKSMNATLNGTRDEAMEQLLSDGAQILNATTAGNDGDSGVRILDTEVPVAGMCIWHPRMHIADAEEVRQRLDSGTAEGMHVVIEPMDGTPFRVYSSKHTSPETRVIPEPWKITGIGEHPALEEIRAQAGE